MALAGSLALASPAAIAAPKPPLSHSGRWITDAQGRVVIVHGSNMVYKLPPYYPSAIGFSADDAAFLHRVGFNAVRVGVIWKAVEPKPGVFSAAYVRRISQTVHVLARHGIYSLLDFHQDMYNERFQGEGAPNWAVEDDGLPATPKEGFPLNYFVMVALWRAFDHFWANSPGPGGVGLETRFAGAWRFVAKRFAPNPAVLGFELFNEPFPGTGWATCATSGGCPAFDAKLTAFNRRVDRAIRKVDHRTLVWYEPNVAFDFGYVTNVGPLRDREAGFAFHDYCLTDEAKGCSSQKTGFQNAVAHVSQTHEALMLTEFGATNSVSDLEGMVALADQHMVPWLEWAYTGFDPTTSGGPAQAIVRDPRKPPRGSNVVWSTLRALVEPYPQVIAGTPSSWGFDRQRRTFRLVYTRRRASGRGRFSPGSVTEISVPRLVYPHHYGVRVVGGQILSKPRARVLRIAACRLQRITVTVTATGPFRESCAAA